MKTNYYIIFILLIILVFSCSIGVYNGSGITKKSDNSTNNTKDSDNTGILTHPVTNVISDKSWTIISETDETIIYSMPLKDIEQLIPDIIIVHQSLKSEINMLFEVNKVKVISSSSQFATVEVKGKQKSFYEVFKYYEIKEFKKEIPIDLSINEKFVVREFESDADYTHTLKKDPNPKNSGFNASLRESITEETDPNDPSKKQIIKGKIIRGLNYVDGEKFKKITPLSPYTELAGTASIGGEETKGTWIYIQTQKKLEDGKYQTGWVFDGLLEPKKELDVDAKIIMNSLSLKYKPTIKVSIDDINHSEFLVDGKIEGEDKLFKDFDIDLVYKMAHEKPLEEAVLVKEFSTKVENIEINFEYDSPYIKSSDNFDPNYPYITNAPSYDYAIYLENNPGVMVKKEENKIESNINVQILDRAIAKSLHPERGYDLWYLIKTKSNKSGWVLSDKIIEDPDRADPENIIKRKVTFNIKGTIISEIKVRYKIKTEGSGKLNFSSSYAGKDYVGGMSWKNSIWYPKKNVEGGISSAISTFTFDKKCNIDIGIEIAYKIKIFDILIPAITQEFQTRFNYPNPHEPESKKPQIRGWAKSTFKKEHLNFLKKGEIVINPNILKNEIDEDSEAGEEAIQLENKIIYDEEIGKLKPSLLLTYVSTIVSARDDTPTYKTLAYDVTDDNTLLVPHETKTDVNVNPQDNGIHLTVQSSQTVPTQHQAFLSNTFVHQDNFINENLNPSGGTHYAKYGESIGVFGKTRFYGSNGSYIYGKFEYGRNSRRNYTLDETGDIDKGNFVIEQNGTTRATFYDGGGWVDVERYTLKDYMLKYNKYDSDNSKFDSFLNEGSNIDNDYESVVMIDGMNRAYDKDGYNWQRVIPIAALSDDKAIYITQQFNAPLNPRSPGNEFTSTQYREVVIDGWALGKKDGKLTGGQVLVSTGTYKTTLVKKGTIKNTNYNLKENLWIGDNSIFSTDYNVLQENKPEMYFDGGINDPAPDMVYHVGPGESDAFYSLFVDISAIGIITATNGGYSGSQKVRNVYNPNAIPPHNKNSLYIEPLYFPNIYKSDISSTKNIQVMSFDHYNGDINFILFYSYNMINEKVRREDQHGTKDLTTGTTYNMVYKANDDKIVTRTVAEITNIKKYVIKPTIAWRFGEELISDNTNGNRIRHLSCQLNYGMMVYTYNLYEYNNNTKAEEFKHRVVGVINIDNEAFPEGYQKEFILKDDDERFGDFKKTQLAAIAIHYFDTNKEF